MKITITGRSGLDSFEGKGTSEDPYIIKTVDDFKKIDEYVLSGDFLGGAVFRMANDIDCRLIGSPSVKIKADMVKICCLSAAPLTAQATN